MAGFNEMISRNGAEALIPVEESKQIIQGITEESAVMKLAKRLPNMSSKTLKMPVLSSLPYAYFVDGDTGMKQTTKVDWGNKVITAEEIAVIVPVADAILADAEYDIWAQIRPLVAQAFGQVIDAAIDQAIGECEAKGIKGKETTPFLLARVSELTGGDSLASNIQLVFNNAKVAALTAVAYCKN